MIELIVKWTGLVVICLVLQTSLISSLSIHGVQPDLIVVIMFFIAIRFGVMGGVFIGFFLGLGLDLYSPAILGQSALAMTITGGFAGIFNERVMKTEPLVKIILLFLTFLIHDLIFITVELVENSRGVLYLFSEVLSHTIPRALYSMVVLLIIYLWSFVIKPGLKR